MSTLPLAGPAAAAVPSAVAALRRSLPSIVLATLVGAFLLASPALDGVVYGDGSWVSYGTAPGASSGYVLAALVVVVVGVLLGRAHPVWATVLVLLPFLGYAWLGWWAYGWWLALVAVAMLAALDGPVRAVVPVVAAVGVALWFCAAPVVASVPIGLTDSGSGSGFSAYVFVAHVVAVGAAVSLAAAAGSSARSRARTRAAESQERRALEVESAAAERARLARDLHDVVAHHVSLVVVRAESAPFQYPDLDDDAREVLAAVAADGRQALGELRQVLTVLRRSEAADGAERAPQPGAQDVDALVAAARDAGQEVRVSGAWRDIDEPTGYVLYRVVQECLTNARRHAFGEPVDVELRSDARGVGLVVRNAFTQPAPERPVVPGRGLVGMRERVEALGGLLDVRTAGGQFVVEALIPDGSSDAPVAGPGNRA
ncbi:sensor histidine kinase [Cellulomonas algicola]|uniref:sensor histidine kinase n=1 Tax=Cellulomonas algicola TaxID=2071633 RepID=UPI001C3F5410|nr:histidine kinase [Cellulomonas algicola]